MPTPQENEAEAKKIWEEVNGVTTSTASPAAHSTTATADAAADTAALAAVDKPAAEANPYEGIDQRIVDEIAGLKAMFGQAQTQLRAAHGKIGELGGKLKQVQSAPAPTATAMPTNAQVAAAAGNTGAMAKLKEDYPEFGAAMDLALEERMAPLKEQLARVATTPAAAPVVQGLTQADLQAVRSDLLVEQVHPGWRDRVRTPEFAGWLQRQPAETKALAASDSPQDSIALLNLHAGVRNEPVQTTTTQRLSAAAAIPTGRASSAARIKPVDRMTDAEYWSYINDPANAKPVATA